MYSSIEGFLVTHLHLVPVELGKNYCIFLKCNQKRSWDTQEGVLWESCSWLWVSVALLKIKPVRVGGKGRSHSFFMKDSCPFFIPSHAIVLSRCGFSFPLSSRHDIPLPTLHLGLGFPCLLPSNQGLDLPFRECVFRGRGLIQGQKIIGLDGN